MHEALKTDDVGNQSNDREMAKIARKTVEKIHDFTNYRNGRKGQQQQLGRGSVVRRVGIIKMQDVGSIVSPLEPPGVVWCGVSTFTYSLTRGL